MKTAFINSKLSSVDRIVISSYTQASSYVSGTKYYKKDSDNYYESVSISSFESGVTYYTQTITNELYPGSSKENLGLSVYSEYGWNFYLDSYNLLNDLKEKTKFYSLTQSDQITSTLFPTYTNSSVSSSKNFFGNLSVGEQNLILIPLKENDSFVDIYTDIQSIYEETSDPISPYVIYTGSPAVGTYYTFDGTVYTEVVISVVDDFDQTKIYYVKNIVTDKIYYTKNIETGLYTQVPSGTQFSEGTIYYEKNVPEGDIYKFNDSGIFQKDSYTTPNTGDYYTMTESITVSFDSTESLYSKVLWIVLTPTGSSKDINLSYVSWSSLEKPARNLDKYLIPTSKINNPPSIVQNVWGSSIMDTASGTLLGEYNNSGVSSDGYSIIGRPLVNDPIRKADSDNIYFLWTGPFDSTYEYYTKNDDGTYTLASGITEFDSGVDYYCVKSRDAVYWNPTTQYSKGNVVSYSDAIYTSILSGVMNPVPNNVLSSGQYIIDSNGNISYDGNTYRLYTNEDAFYKLTDSLSMNNDLLDYFVTTNETNYIITGGTTYLDPTNDYFTFSYVSSQNTCEGVRFYKSDGTESKEGGYIRLVHKVAAPVSGTTYYTNNPKVYVKLKSNERVTPDRFIRTLGKLDKAYTISGGVATCVDDSVDTVNTYYFMCPRNGDVTATYNGVSSKFRVIKFYYESGDERDINSEISGGSTLLVNYSLYQYIDSAYIEDDRIIYSVDSVIYSSDTFYRRFQADLDLLYSSSTVNGNIITSNSTYLIIDGPVIFSSYYSDELGRVDYLSDSYLSYQVNDVNGSSVYPTGINEIDFYDKTTTANLVTRTDGGTYYKKSNTGMTDALLNGVTTMFTEIPSQYLYTNGGINMGKNPLIYVNYWNRNDYRW